MTQFFEDKSARILVVEPAAATRALLSEELRNLGFNNCRGVDSLQDAIGVLEVEPIDWVITSLFARYSVNALQLLQIFTLVPALQGTRMSLLIEQEEVFCLRSAFELGLVSWHAKPFSKESLRETLKTLLQKMEANKWNLCLTAADYLREFLQKQSIPRSLLALEKSLTSLFPGNGKLLMHLGTAQYYSGNNEAAANLLYQANLLDPSLSEEIDGLSKKYFGEKGLKELSKDVKINTLGISSCVLVDSDETVLRAVEDILKKLNVSNIQSFLDGESAWEHIKSNPEPSLIIQEWKIPKLTGPFLVQRIRQHGFQSVPVIVLSSLVKKDDLDLVREMGVANVISKPFDQQFFISEIVGTLQQDRLPTEAQTIERKLLSCLAMGSMEEAESLKQQFFADPAVAEARRVFIEGEFAYYNKEYERARDFAVTSLRMQETVFVLNLLGKTLMKLRKFEPALKCFKKAQSMTPLNIERLCQIAEVETEAGHKEGAEEAMTRAKNLDQDSKLVKETEAKVEMTLGSTEKARLLMQELQSLDNIVAFMNNRAISFTRCGEISQGIEHYIRALEALPENQKEIKSVVHFNLALAYSRDRNFSEAVKELEKALGHPSASIKERAASLKYRLEDAIRTGRTAVLKFADSDDSSKSVASKPPPEGGGNSAWDQYQKVGETEGEVKELSDDENRKVVAVMEAKKGTMCCYLVFNDPTEKDPRSVQLVQSLPGFKFRKTMKRDEALVYRRDRSKHYEVQRKDAEQEEVSEVDKAKKPTAKK